MLLLLLPRFLGVLCQTGFEVVGSLAKQIAVQRKPFFLAADENVDDMMIE